AKAAEAFFLQVFRDGFFHADMHAGNLFVRSDGSIAAVDFGIMGRLDTSTRYALAQLLLGFLSRDYRRAAEVHFEAGWVPSHRSVAAFTQACRSIGEPILDKPQNEISIGHLLGQLFQITKTFEMEVQTDLLLLQRTILVAEGTGRALCPEANMWLLARPLIERWMAGALSPDVRVREAAREFTTTLARLPEIMRRIEDAAASIADGSIRLHPQTIWALRGEDRRASTRVIWISIAFILVLIFLA
ncbi:MAG: AarF/UbiB family protein, partial [Rhodoplanes sp.]